MEVASSAAAPLVRMAALRDVQAVAHAEDATAAARTHAMAAEDAIAAALAALAVQAVPGHALLDALALVVPGAERPAAHLAGPAAPPTVPDAVRRAVPDAVHVAAAEAPAVLIVLQIAGILAGTSALVLLLPRFINIFENTLK